MRQIDTLMDDSQWFGHLTYPLLLFIWQHLLTSTSQYFCESSSFSFFNSYKATECKI